MRPSIQRTLLPAAFAQPCARGMRTSVYIAAALALGIAANAGAQTIHYNVRTGDAWVDNRLGEINDYGYRNRDPFVSEMVTNYAVPRPYVEQLLQQRRWSPGDVYYACALAHSLGRPCSDVVEEHDRDRGRGWGVTARRLGIQPGSPQFFALKNGVVGTYGRWGHPIMVDRVEHVRWGEDGDRMRPTYMKHGKIKHGNYKRIEYEHGRDDEHGRGGKHGDDGDEGDRGGDGGHGHGEGGEHGHGNEHGKGHK